MVDEYGRQVDALIKMFSDGIVKYRAEAKKNPTIVGQMESAIAVLKKAILQRDEYLNRPQVE